MPRNKVARPYGKVMPSSASVLADAHHRDSPTHHNGVVDALARKI